MPAFQLHHSTYWDRLCLDLADAIVWLGTIEEVTGFKQPGFRRDLERLRDTAAAERKAGRHRLDMLMFTDKPRYERCHRGLEPWPGELGPEEREAA